jgi:cardiolipin synthase A/B
VVTRRILSRRGRRAIFRTMRVYFRRHRVNERWLYGLRMLYRVRVQLILRLEQSIGRMARRREARLYVDGEEAFDHIERLLRKAKHTVIIHMFIWMDDVTGRRIAERLVEAADRGVSIHITKDITGDIFELDQDFLTTRTVETGVWQRFWSHPNIVVEAVADRNHAKVYVIDGEIMLLGGMNISDQYRYQWHDFLVELRGHRFVEEYLSGVHAVMGEGRVHLVMNTARSRAVRSTLMELLQSAQEELILEQAYFSDPAVVELLARRSTDGISVRVIVPSRPDVHRSANTVAVATLIGRGDPRYLQVFQYPGMLHGKLVLADRKRAFIGSANIMTSSLDAMGEVNVLLAGRHTTVLRRVREVVRADLFRSTPLLVPPQLKWLTRILAWMGL